MGEWNRYENGGEGRRRAPDDRQGQPRRGAGPYGGRGLEHVGQEPQGGWRGPGAIPGYREAREGSRPFLQPTSGGQIPGELREWERPAPRDHDPRDRDRDPRTGRLEALPRRGGPHAGRGPRGYQRSDARIHEELCERLTADPWLDARDLEVEVSGARVLLRGTVPERAMKHRAEDLADAIFGVAEIENHVRVQRPGGARGRRPGVEGPADEETRRADQSAEERP